MQHCTAGAFHCTTGPAGAYSLEDRNDDKIAKYGIFRMAKKNEGYHTIRITNLSSSTNLSLSGVNDAHISR